MAITITASERRLLKSVNIPPRPETLILVSKEAKQAEPDVSVIAKAIAADVGISAAVLQVVNSAAFRRARDIDSIHQAVMTLGFKRVFPIVRAVALKSALQQNEQLANFWDYNERVAAASMLVAEQLGRSAAKDHVYMLGLFQAAGIPVMMSAFSDYDEILERSDELPWHRLIEEERSRYDTTHTTVGALLAQQWSLPKVLVEVIYYLHEHEDVYLSGELDSLGVDLLSMVKIGRYIADLSFRPDAAEADWERVRDTILARFYLEDYALEELVADIQERLSATSAA